MIDIFFIRHGATEGNLRRRYIGRTDEPLCEAGIAQVKALQKRGLSVDRLFVSPMLRTRQTADILAANREDLAAAKGTMSDVMLDRLALDETRIAAMADGIRQGDDEVIDELVTTLQKLMK